MYMTEPVEWDNNVGPCQKNDELYDAKNKEKGCAKMEARGNSARGDRDKDEGQNKYYVELHVEDDYPQNRVAIIPFQNKAYESTLVNDLMRISFKRKSKASSSPRKNKKN